MKGRVLRNFKNGTYIEKAPSPIRRMRARKGPDRNEWIGKGEELRVRWKRRGNCGMALIHHTHIPIQGETGQGTDEIGVE